MKSVVRFLLLGGALLLSSAAAAFELFHDNGKIVLEAVPQRIVTYDLAVLDSLHALDIPVVGVPRSNYQGRLTAYRELPVAGTLFEPDYEVLDGLGADLIFAGRRSVPAIGELEKRAPVALLNPSPAAFMQDFRRQGLALAQAFGQAAKAESMIAEVEQDVATLTEMNRGKTGVLLFVINEHIIPHAPGDRFGFAYELSGLRSVLPPTPADAPPPVRPEPGSPEARALQAERAKVIDTIVKSEPDWLLILDRGAINGGEKKAAATLAAHSGLSQTRAWQQDRVHYVDPDGWYVITGGFNNMKAMTSALLDEMQRAKGK